jgi:hypothetical protein
MTTRLELKRARKLRSMPATAAALAEGKLSVDKADLLAQVNQPEVAHLFARDEQFLVEQVRPLRFADAVSAVRYWLQIADDEVGKTPSSCRRDGRHLTAVRGIFGTIDVRGTLDAIGGTEFLSELERLELQLFEADWGEARAIHGNDTRVEGLARTGSQRRADAVALMRSARRRCHLARSCRDRCRRHRHFSRRRRTAARRCRHRAHRLRRALTGHRRRRAPAVLPGRAAAGDRGA